MGTPENFSEASQAEFQFCDQQGLHNYTQRHWIHTRTRRCAPDLPTSRPLSLCVFQCGGSAVLLLNCDANGHFSADRSWPPPTGLPTSRPGKPATGTSCPTPLDPVASALASYAYCALLQLAANSVRTVFRPPSRRRREETKVQQLSPATAPL